MSYASIIPLLLFLAVVMIFVGQLIFEIKDFSIVTDVGLEDDLEKIPGAMDTFFAIFAFGMFLMPVGTAFLVRTSPLFLIFSVLLMVSFLFAIPMLANFFTDYSTSQSFAGVIDQYPLMILIMNNLHLLLMFSMGLTAITLYGRVGGE